MENECRTIPTGRGTLMTQGYQYSSAQNEVNILPTSAPQVTEDGKYSIIQVR